MTRINPYGSSTGHLARSPSDDGSVRDPRRAARDPEVWTSAPPRRRSTPNHSQGSPYPTSRAETGRTTRSLSRSTLWEDGELGESHFSGPQPLRARWDPVPPPRSRVGRRRGRAQRRRSAFGWFLHHYGWRAYALPVLAALTVMAVVGLMTTTAPAENAGTEKSGVVTVTMSNSIVTTVTLSPGADTAAIGAPVGPAQTDSSVSAESVSGSATNADFANAKAAASIPPIPSISAASAFEGVVMGVLPPGGSFAQTGAGTFHVIDGTSEPIGTGSDRRTFTVEAEDGIESVAADQEFADAVVDILSGPHSWAAGGKFTLQRIDSGTPDFRITLTSQMTTRQPNYCGWEVQLEASCFNSAQGRVLINDARWVRGAYSYDGDLTSYRVYAINHEVGHALGYSHEACPVSGGLAPVMMQQSWSTADNDVAKLNGGGPVPADGKVCRANPFVVAN